MVCKQKKTKDSTSLGYKTRQCSTSGESPEGDINFLSSNMNSHMQTFKVKDAPRKKIDLNTIAKILKTHVSVPKKENIATSTRNHNANQKGKAKLNDDDFFKVKDTRRNFRIPLVGRRPMWNNHHLNSWYVPEFSSYCYKCNIYAHKFSN